MIDSLGQKGHTLDSRLKITELTTQKLIGHFCVSSGLCIKTWLNAQPLVWKWFFILMLIKLNFNKTGCALGLILKVRFLELGSGLLGCCVFWVFINDSLNSKMNLFLPNHLGCIMNLYYSLLSINLAGSCVLYTVGTCQPNPRQHSVNISAASQLRHQLTLRQ